MTEQVASEGPGRGDEGDLHLVGGDKYQLPQIRTPHKTPDTKPPANKSTTGTPFLTVPSKITHRHKGISIDQSRKPETQDTTGPDSETGAHSGHTILPTFGAVGNKIRGFPSIALRSLKASASYPQELGIARTTRSKSFGAPTLYHQNLKQVQFATTNIPSLTLPPNSDWEDVSDVVTIPSSYLLPSVQLSDAGLTSEVGSHDITSVSRRGSLSESPGDSGAGHGGKTFHLREELRGAEGAERRGSSVSVFVEQFLSDPFSQDKVKARDDGHDVKDKDKDLALPILEHDGTEKSGSSLLIYHCKGTPGDRRYSLPILIDGDKNVKESPEGFPSHADLTDNAPKESIVGFNDSKEVGPHDTLALLTNSMYELDKLREDLLSGLQVQPLTLTSLQKPNILESKPHIFKKRSRPIPVPIGGEVGEMGLFGYLTEQKLDFVQDWLEEVERCREEGDMDGEIVTEGDLSWTYES